MGQPVAHGYQDFNRVFAGAQNQLLQVLGSTIAAPTVLGTFTTVNLHSIGISLLPTANHIQLTIEWFATFPIGVQTTSDAIFIRANGVFDQTVTVKGAFCRITATPFGGATSTYSVIVYEATSSSIAHTQVQDSILTQFQVFNVNAGAVASVEPTRVIAGPAVWFAASLAATWFARIEAITVTGAFVLIDKVTQAESGQNRSLFLPMCTLRVRIDNTSAANANFDLSLNAKPLYP